MAREGLLAALIFFTQRREGAKKVRAEAQRPQRENGEPRKARLSMPVAFDPVAAQKKNAAALSAPLREK
jgi:hypothetical protein